MNSKVNDILPSLTSLLKDCDDSELLEHVLSLLSTLLHNQLTEVKKERDTIVMLKDTLVEKQSRLAPLDYKVVAKIYCLYVDCH